MPENQYIVFAMVLLLLIAAVFVGFIRGIVIFVVRIALFVVGVGVAVGGVTLLMNDETIFEQPGWQPRTTRFLTMQSAATTASGNGWAICKYDKDQAKPAASAMVATPAAQSTSITSHKGKKPAEEPSASPTSAPGVEEPAPSPEEDVYPELIRRGYPGIAREKLYGLAQVTVNSLGGWKIVKADPHSYTLECEYSSRILGAIDDVRIVVLPTGEIDLCSRSDVESRNLLLRLFPGDLGANIGHIKQFYETLEPKMDEVYKEQQEKENAKKPPAHP